MQAAEMLLHRIAVRVFQPMPLYIGITGQPWLFKTVSTMLHVWSKDEMPMMSYNTALSYR